MKYATLYEIDRLLTEALTEAELQLKRANAQATTSWEQDVKDDVMCSDRTREYRAIRDKFEKKYERLVAAAEDFRSQDFH